MSARVSWNKGGDGAIVAIEGEAVRVVSSIPSPPGSRLDGALVDGTKDTVRVKVHGCRREGDGFVIDGRLLDLSRVVRERVAAAVASAP